MSRGYFTIAQGEEYHRMAYALALSIKLSQKTTSKMSIGVTKAEKKKLKKTKYAEVFDEIIEIPWKDAAAKTEWKLENWWKAIHMTPYDETVCLDADMLFFEDHEEWWNLMSQSPAAFCTKPITYRGEIITSDFYRKTFTDNDLPNVYAAFFYFQKNEATYEFFDLCEVIFNNWEKFHYEFLKATSRPNYFSTDVAFGIAAKILEFDKLYSHAFLNIPTFVHMKSQLQDWPNDVFMNEDWTKMVSAQFTPKCQLKIANYLQTVPFHYHVKSFLTDDKIGYLEKELGI
jgi:hypothetical protein